jgi:predicted MFS family arabinose efflux permease
MFLLYFSVGASFALLPRLITNGLHGDKALVGRMWAVFALSAVLCRALLAYVARRGARVLGIVGATFTVAGMALMWRVSSLGVLSVARVFAAIGEALIWTTVGTLSTAFVAEDRQAEAVSYSSVALFVSFGLGASVVEGFSKSGRFNSAVSVCVGAAVLTLIATFSVKNEWIPNTEKKGALTWREVFHPGALLPGLAYGVVILGWSAYANYVTLRSDELGFTSAATIFQVYTATALVVRFFGAKLPERVGLLRCSMAATLFVSAGLVVLSFALTQSTMMLGAAIISIGVALSFPSMSAIALRRLTDPSERSNLISSFGLFFELGSGVGGLVLGPVARSAGLVVTFRVGAVITLLGLVGMAKLRTSSRANTRNPEILGT